MSERFCQKVGCSAIVRNGHHCDAGHLQIKDRNYVPIDLSEDVSELSMSAQQVLEEITRWPEQKRMFFLADALQRECEYGVHSDVLRDTLADGMRRIRMEKLS